MTRLSIITPAYNTGKYISECVKSVLKQELSDFELMLVDDGSTDYSGEYLDQQAEKDTRIIVIHQINQGQAAARNHALNIIQGEYIGFVDSDDYIHPQMFEMLLNNARKHNAQISVCGYRSVNDYKPIESKDTLNSNGKLWDGKSFLTHCLLDGIDKKPWVLWDKVFHRSCFDNLRMPEGRIHEDNAVVYKLLYEAERVADCNAPLYFYFQNPNSTVNQAFKVKHLDWLLVPQEMIEYFNEKQDEVLWDKANKMYLNAIADSYQKAHKYLNDSEINAQLRKQLKKQFQHKKSRYPISIKSHPQVYEILYPRLTGFYWTVKGILSKFRRK